MSCQGNCGSCSGCAKVLELTEGEIHVLLTLGQYAFLPIARRADDMVPVYLEDDRHTKEEYSLILQVLEQKNLISLDYDKPLSHADMSFAFTLNFPFVSVVDKIIHASTLLR